MLIVGTHRDETRASVDYEQLKSEFPGMLADHPFEVDSATGSGIGQLRDAIAREAARLPRMGEVLPAEWTDARREVLALAQARPSIPLSEFTRICERNEVPPSDIGELAGLMHELGQIVCYADDKELRDVVVLDPAWLTQAISRVLADQLTREAGGVLDHARLAQIWTEADGYPRAQHPYFLNVMEKFLISYRPEGDDRKSLIAQLVPVARPALPWNADTPVPAGKRSLRLRCRLREPVPGLIALLTVRLRRMSTGKHWRRGVFLRHWRADYDSEALVELLGNSTLAAEVRAPVPDLFFHVVLDSLEELLRERWPGLRYDLMIPCTGVDDHGPCPGEFKLENLTRRRARGRTTITCGECDADLPVSELLTGFAGTGTVTDHLELLPEILRGQQRIEERVTFVADSTRLLLAAVNNEVTKCPRLFTLEPASATGTQRLEVHKRHYDLTLWCEYPDGPHPLAGHSYAIGEPKEWFTKLRPYLRVMLKFLQVASPVAGAIAGAAGAGAGPGPQTQGIGDSFRAMSDLLDKGEHIADAVLERAVDDEEGDGLKDTGYRDGAPRLAPAEGAALRAFEELMLNHLDGARNFGGLRPALSSTGSFLWLCPKHFPKYDRGLPVIVDPFGTIGP